MARHYQGQEGDYYAYRIIYSEEDGEFVGLCSEFPILSWLDKSPEKALKGIRKVVSEVLGDMEATGETPPAPISRKKFSGKLSLRVTPETHRNRILKSFRLKDQDKIAFLK